jgi:hypothetical protein
MAGLNLLEMTNTAGTRDEGWPAFRRARDARLRERYHGIVLRLDGQSCPELAPWLSRAEEASRAWSHALNEAGLHGLERAASPGRRT